MSVEEVFILLCHATCTMQLAPCTLYPASYTCTLQLLLPINSNNLENLDILLIIDYPQEYNVEE